jgi:hypothetical protein
MTMNTFSRSDWDREDFALSPGRYYVPRSAFWEVRDSCRVVTVSVNPGQGAIADEPSEERMRLVVFRMTVGKENGFDQDNSHFDDIKSHQHSSSELKPLFLFVVPEETFPSFRIDLVGSGLPDDVDVGVMGVPVS